MGFKLGQIERSVLSRHLQDWLDDERPLFAIYIESIHGKGNTQRTTQRGELVGEIIDEYPSTAEIVDHFVESYGSFQKLQLRAVWLKDGENGPEADWEHTKTKRFTVTPEAPGSRSGSQGSDAATERLSQSLSTGFDTMISRNDESQQRTLEALKGNSDQMERFFSTLLTMQSDGANTATLQAVELQKAISETQLAEFKLELLIADQNHGFGSLLLQALPDLLQSPLMSNLASLVGAMANRVNEEAGALGPGPEEDSPAPPPEPGQDSPAGPAPSVG